MKYTFLFLLIIQQSDQCVGQTSKEDVARLYVAYFELYIYSSDIILGNNTYKSSKNSLATSIVSPKEIKEKYVSWKYKEKFNGLEVFCVSHACRHCSPYIVGIDDELNIYRMYGFGTNISDISEQIDRNYNDTTYYLDFRDQKSILSVDVKSFVKNYLRLVEFGDISENLEFTSEEVDLISTTILGRITTKYYVSRRDNKFVEIDWKYAISRDGYVSLSQNASRNHGVEIIDGKVIDEN